jgi:hypothetical protein
MCLDNVLTKKKFFEQYSLKPDPKNPNIKVGWKIITLIKNKAYPGNHDDDIPFKIGSWMHESSLRERCLYYKRLNSSCGKSYPIGFHVCINKKSAELFAQDYGFLTSRGGRIIKVYFKDECAYGIQDSSILIITKDIYIPHQLPFGTTGRCSPCKIRI